MWEFLPSEKKFLNCLITKSFENLYTQWDFLTFLSYCQNVRNEADYSNNIEKHELNQTSSFTYICVKNCTNFKIWQAWSVSDTGKFGLFSST